MRFVVIAALLVAGCAGTATPQPEASKRTMTPEQEAEAWCALGFLAPGMAGWCDEKPAANREGRK